MNKIFNIKDAITISKKVKSKNKHIVLVGGCFDILHIGHINFLNKAKKTGDLLFVLLESDNNVKKIKGSNRPINNQQERANMLSALESVNAVFLLPDFDNNLSYDELIEKIKPDILAITEDDPGKIHKVRQAKKINAKVLSVIRRVPNKSSSEILKSILK